MYIITGASRGIGRYLFDHLTKEGEVVFGTYNTTPPNDGLNNQLLHVDVTDPNQVSAWIGLIRPQLKEIVLINCAAINYNSFAHKANLSRWEQVVRVNLFGTFNVIHALLPIMRSENYGRIINFSSVVAQVPTQGVSAYAASKSALWGLSRSLAAENAKKNITINNLNLGYFDIGIIREVSPVFKDAIKARIPSGAFGKPEDILKAIKFLVATEYLNGSSIDLSAGLV